MSQTNEGEGEQQGEEREDSPAYASAAEEQAQQRSQRWSEEEWRAWEEGRWQPRSAQGLSRQTESSGDSADQWAAWLGWGLVGEAEL